MNFELVIKGIWGLKNYLVNKKLLKIFEFFLKELVDY